MKTKSSVRVDVDDDLKLRLQAEAERQRRSEAWIVREALELYLAARPSGNEEGET